MKYFVAKIQYQEPIPGKEGVKKVKKQYLVRAVSVTDAETIVQGWWPANWQEPTILDVVTSQLNEIITEGESETWWRFKVMFENPENGKWTPEFIIANGGTIDAVLPRIKKACPMGEIEEVKKFKTIVDEDLTKEN